MGRKKGQTQVDMPFMLASGVPADGDGWCERDRKRMKSVETGKGELYCGCPTCGQSFMREPLGPFIVVSAKMIGKSLPQFEIVSRDPVVFLFSTSDPARTWSMTMPRGW